MSVLASEQLLPSKHAVEAIKKYKIDSEKPMPTKIIMSTIDIKVPNIGDFKDVEIIEVLVTEWTGN